MARAVRDEGTRAGHSLPPFLPIYQQPRHPSVGGFFVFTQQDMPCALISLWNFGQQPRMTLA
jgi:hypothetical protein